MSGEGEPPWEVESVCGTSTFSDITGRGAQNVAKDTLDDIFSRVDTLLEKTRSEGGSAPSKDGSVPAALVEISVALDEARSKLRSADRELQYWRAARPDAGEQGDAATWRAQAQRAETRAQALEAELTHLKRPAERDTSRELREAAATIARLQAELQLTRHDLANRDKKQPESETQQKLLAANGEIAQLNQQMAHLFTELTFARTELATRPEGEAAATTTSQVPELLQDIRHLQLDLEFHQQKLHEVEEERGRLHRDLAQALDVLAAKELAAEEQAQAIKHLEVEVACRGPKDGSAVMEPTDTSSLRKELKAKEGLLTISHYELHKEKLSRQRAEGRVAKLRDRLEKLMAVVEHQRKGARQLETRAALAEQAAQLKHGQLETASNQVAKLTYVLGKAEPRKELRGKAHLPAVPGASPRKD